MNIIDFVSLTPDGVAAWSEACKTGISKLRDAGVAPGQVGIEEAYEQPDGALVIQCKAGGIVLRLRLEPKEWCHAN